MSQRKVTNEDLIRYAAGELDAGHAAAVEAWLAGEGRCEATRVRRLRAAVATMRTDDSRSPAAAALARYEGIFRPHAKGPGESWLDAVTRVVASLVFDSRQQPALAGLRGSATAAQVSFESELADVEMELEPAEGGGAQWFITGQITPHGEPGQIRLGFGRAGVASAPVREVAVDEHGAFTATLAAGTYDLLIGVGVAVVVIAEFRVGDQAA